jgi:queuine/archaeosine tRNA-ribosyltransferase
MTEIREAIREDRFAAFREDFFVQSGEYHDPPSKK